MAGHATECERQQRGAVTIAVHDRQGDAGKRILGTSYFGHVCGQLCAVWSHANAASRLALPAFKLHTDGSEDDRAMLEAVIRDSCAASGAEVTIELGSSDTMEALQQMAHAQILIMSVSSLSYAAALLGNHSTVIFPGREIEPCRADGAELFGRF